MNSSRDFVEFKTEYVLRQELDAGRSLPESTHLLPLNLMRLAASRQGRNAVRDHLRLDPRSQQTALNLALESQFGKTSPAISAAATVPRHLLVPIESQAIAYVNSIVYIEGLNALTPPWLSVLSADRLALRKGHRTGVIGFGNGYLSMVFGGVVGSEGRVIAWDIDASLVKAGNELADKLGLRNIEVHAANALKALPGGEALDSLWVTLATTEIPDLWTDSVKEGGVIGVFRVWTEAEWSEVGHGSYQDYRRGRWWENVCLVFMEKSPSGLVDVSKIRDFFNVPMEAGPIPEDLPDYYASYRFQEECLREILNESA